MTSCCRELPNLDNLWIYEREKQQLLSQLNYYHFGYLCYSSLAHILTNIPPIFLPVRVSPPLLCAAAAHHLYASMSYEHSWLLHVYVSSSQ